MTVIGAPWYLAREYASSHVLGTVMIVTVIANLLFSPYAGALIDRHPRRSILLAENIMGFLGLGIAALVGYFWGYSLVLVGGMYIFTVMIFFVHFPATYALAQESFPRDWYGSISSMMEVVTQTAAIVAGGLAGLILEHYGLTIVFAIDSLTYLVALWLVWGFKYQIIVGAVRKAPEFFAEIHTSLKYLRSRPHFTLITLALYVPFMVLISMELLQPFYVQQALHGQATIYSLIEGFYAIGATAAGLWMRRLSTRVGDRMAYISAFILFTAAVATMAIVPITSVALLMMVGVGWANAGIRVNRVTFVMQEIPTELIGRVNTFFNWIGLLGRGALIAFFTWSVDALGTRWSYASAALLLAAAFAMYLLQYQRAKEEHEARGAT